MVYMFGVRVKENKSILTIFSIITPCGSKKILHLYHIKNNSIVRLFSYHILFLSCPIGEIFNKKINPKVFLFLAFKVKIKLNEKNLKLNELILTYPLLPAHRPLNVRSSSPPSPFKKF